MSASLTIARSVIAGGGLHAWTARSKEGGMEVG